MEKPDLTPELIAELPGLLAQYITTQREKYAPRAIPLSEHQKAAMAGFFPLELLDHARFLALIEERVSNPAFYPTLETVGFNNLPNMSAMQAITFCDTIVSHGPSPDATLFHELVHVVQYRQLGTLDFSALYVRGFLNGGSYEAIPLEQSAYALQSRFENDRTQRFSVVDDVVGWIATDRF